MLWHDSRGPQTRVLNSRDLQNEQEIFDKRGKEKNSSEPSLLIWRLIVIRSLLMRNNRHLHSITWCHVSHAYQWTRASSWWTNGYTCMYSFTSWVQQSYYLMLQFKISEMLDATCLLIIFSPLSHYIAIVRLAKQELNLEVYTKSFCRTKIRLSEPVSNRISII